MVLPGVYQWVHESIDTILNEITLPQEITFRLPNHAAFLPLIERKHLGRYFLDIFCF